MQKIGIVTIIDFNNYGNRLQNFALQNYLSKKYKLDVVTLLNEDFSNDKKFYFLRLLKHFLLKKNYDCNINTVRYENFCKFNKNIKFSETKINCFTDLENYDFLIVGSDQVWNPNFRRLRDVDLLVNVSPQKRISYAASFGITHLNKKYNKKIIKNLSKFKSISVREDAGKKIINELIDNNVEVLIDPTMLLTATEWDQVSVKPKMIQNSNFIFTYFLGELSEKRKIEIDRIAKEYNCEIIDVLDENSPFYGCGPSEFLWLEKNAFLICTDSFHSSVFAILYNKPFVIFDREQNGMINMNSRIETLLSKFKIKNRKFEGYITKENLKYDYSEAYEILEKERIKSFEFLSNSLEINYSEKRYDR